MNGWGLSVGRCSCWSEHDIMLPFYRSKVLEFLWSNHPVVQEHPARPSYTCKMAGCLQGNQLSICTGLESANRPPANNQLGQKSEESLHWSQWDFFFIYILNASTITNTMHSNPSRTHSSKSKPAIVFQWDQKWSMISITITSIKLKNQKPKLLATTSEKMSPTSSSWIWAQTLSDQVLGRDSRNG